MATNTTVALGHRIRSFRKRLGLTQKSLASQMGFSSAETISQIERGDREVKAWELVKLANILLVDVSGLLSVKEPKSQPLILWRKSPKVQKKLKEAEFLKHCQQYAVLEELSGAGSHRHLPNKVVDPERIDFPDAARIAEDTRQEFNLGGRPALSLEKTLQDRYGVKVWYDEFDEGSAAATIGPFGPAILINKNEAPWRRNYNFAHEVFHLLTWESISPELLSKNKPLCERIEKIANYFASCLLLPASAVREEVEEHLVDQKMEYIDLVEIARSFDVSTEALLYRLLNLRFFTQETVESLLKDEKFRDLDRSTMADRWRVPRKFPDRFVRLAFFAYQKGKLSKSKLAQFLETSLFDVTDTLREYGFDDREGYNAEVRAV